MNVHAHEHTPTPILLPNQNQVCQCCSYSIFLFGKILAIKKIGAHVSHLQCGRGCISYPLPTPSCRAYPLLNACPEMQSTPCRTNMEHGEQPTHLADGTTGYTPLVDCQADLALVHTRPIIQCTPHRIRNGGIRDQVLGCVAEFPW